MDDSRYQRAVEAAHRFRKALAKFESQPPSEALASFLLMHGAPNLVEVSPSTPAEPPLRFLPVRRGRPLSDMALTKVLRD
ncbi:MAG: hypothetical protein OXC14_01170, partial [Rhodospirillaceae bacterium]|nr:hypothetical protein [Rhodospirillaceae bacterium]